MLEECIGECESLLSLRSDLLLDRVLLSHLESRPEARRRRGQETLRASSAFLKVLMPLLVQLYEIVVA